MASAIDHLKSVPLLADLDESEWDEIAPLATEVQVPRGQVIMREGSLGYELVVVLEGTLQVTRGGSHIADISLGEFVGEMALICRTRRNSTVTAKTDATLLVLDGRGFSDVLDRVPRLAVKMLPVVASRAIGTSATD